MLKFIFIIGALYSVVSKNIQTRGDLFVGSELKISSLIMEKDNSTLLCKKMTSEQLLASHLVSEKTRIKELSVENLIPKKDNALKIYGLMDIKGNIKWQGGEVPKSSFLETKIISSTNSTQWSVLSRENVILNPKDLFSKKKRKYFSRMLRKLAKSEKPILAEKQDLPILKTEYFSNLPTHKFVKIEGNMIFNSREWEGQAAFIKVDERLVWFEHHDWQEYESPEESQYSTPISLVIKHTGTSVLIEIGATFKSNQKIIEFEDFTISLKE